MIRFIFGLTRFLRLAPLWGLIGGTWLSKATGRGN